MRTFLHYLKRIPYAGVVMLVLWAVFVANTASAQELVRADHSLGTPRSLLLPAPDATPRFAADRRLVGVAGVRGQSPANEPARGPARKVFGTLVGATAGFFAGGYLGAAIEGDRCNCDDPGLKGALIGMPIGAAVGGVLGYHFLF